MFELSLGSLILKGSIYMPLSFTSRKRIRKDFGRIGSATPMPNLIEVQKASWDAFLQFGVNDTEREEVGLQAVFKSVLKI